MFRPFHHVMSLFSLVNLTGLLFACLEFLWVLFCLNTSFSGQKVRHPSNLALPLATLHVHGGQLGKTVNLSER